MDQLQYALEMAAFEEKIYLAEIEVKKAEERAAELRYSKARFQLECVKQTAAKQGKD